MVAGQAIGGRYGRPAGGNQETMERLRSPSGGP
jgi:hypothetical protein